MSIAQLKKIARTLKQTYALIDAELLKSGKLLSPADYDFVISKARQKILTEQGFTEEEYNLAKEEYLTAKKTEQDAKKTSLDQVLQKVSQLKGEQGVQGEKGDKGDMGEKGNTGEQGVQGVQGIKGDKGDMGLTGDKGDKGDSFDETTIAYLEDKIQTVEQKIPATSEINLPQLKEEILKQADANLAASIQIKWQKDMPDFRKLAMGLEGRISALEGGSGDVAKILAGTGITISPSGGQGTVTITNSATFAGVTVDAPLTGLGTPASHLSIPVATTSVNGYLSSTDWTTFNNKQATISNSDGTITISSNVASLALGHANTWTGQQTFGTSAPIFSTMTAGSVLFAGTSGVLSQDNSNFFFDSTNHRLGIGTTAPAVQLHQVATLPEERLQTSGDSQYTRVNRTTSNVATRYNQVSQPGTLGNAGGYTASTSYSAKTSFNGLNRSTGSASLWVYMTTMPTGGAKGYLINLDGNGTGGDGKLILRYTNSTLELVLNGSGIYNTVPSDLNTWVHYVVTWDTVGNSIILYRNTTVLSSQTFAGLGTGSGAISMGSIGDVNRTITGLLDEVVVWNGTQISAGVVSTLYNSGAGYYVQYTDATVNGSTTSAIYHFDESGTQGTLADSSSAANNGASATSVVMTSGLINSPATTQEATLWSSQNGLSALERGINTFGDGNGRTVLNGQTMNFQIGGTQYANFNSSGRLFIGSSTSATAVLHLKAGTATASTAPLKFTTGTNLTTAEAGAMEYATPDLFFTPGSATRYNLPLVSGAGVQGDLLYASAASIYSRLAKDANSTRYLSNQGSSNNPSWNQVNLTNGVTGALPIANGGTGQTTLVLAGINAVVASTFERAETAVDANVLTYTTNASTDEFLVVQVVMDVSAITGTSITATATWKDSNNATQTQSVVLTGVADGTINIPINALKNTNVVVSTTGVAIVSVAYNISAFITRLK